MFKILTNKELKKYSEEIVIIDWNLSNFFFYFCIYLPLSLFLFCIEFIEYKMVKCDAINLFSPPYGVKIKLKGHLPKFHTQESLLLNLSIHGESSKYRGNYLCL